MRSTHRRSAATSPKKRIAFSGRPSRSEQPYQQDHQRGRFPRHAGTRPGMTWPPRAGGACRAAASGIAWRWRGRIEFIAVIPVGLFCHFWPRPPLQALILKLLGFSTWLRSGRLAVPPFSSQAPCLISLGRLGRGQSLGGPGEALPTKYRRSAPDTRSGAGRADGSSPAGVIDITCISPNGFVLPFCRRRARSLS